LKVGQQIQLRVDFPSSHSSEDRIHVNYREIARLVKPNDLIYIDDGKIVLLVVDCTMEGVLCEVKGVSGVLGGNKNVKLPTGKHEHMPAITHSD
jgi:pyruvate kinase